MHGTVAVEVCSKIKEAALSTFCYVPCNPGCENIRGG